MGRPAKRGSGFTSGVVRRIRRPFAGASTLSEQPSTEPQSSEESPEPKHVSRVDEVKLREIIGTLIRTSGESARLALMLNDIPVDELEVPIHDGGVSPFRFAIKDLWQFCSVDDVISVRRDGVPLPMPGGGDTHPVISVGELTHDELRERLNDGEIMDSWGRLIVPKYEDLQWQRAVTDLYRAIHDAVEEIAGYQPFLVYGSLLGAVREGRPLGHDLDLDSAYLSKHTDPIEVQAEAGRIALELQRRGFGVEARVTCIHVSNPERTERIDLYHWYFNSDGHLRLPWGSVSEEPFREDQWAGLEEIEYAGAPVLIPRNAEDLVSTLYGPDWRTPNPGFDWARVEKVQASEAFFPEQLRPIINWQDYWSYASIDAPSSFARSVLPHGVESSLIIDLGCGDGRDVPKFLRAGAVVLGLDWSHHAIESAKGRQLSQEHAQFTVCDLSQVGGARSGPFRELARGTTPGVLRATTRGLHPRREARSSIR